MNIQERNKEEWIKSFKYILDKMIDDYLEKCASSSSSYEELKEVHSKRLLIDDVLLRAKVALIDEQ